MPEILLPTASKQNEIYEDVKQLKESLGAGKKYETRVHSFYVSKGGTSEVSFKGVLVSVSITGEDGNGTLLKNMKIDGENVFPDVEGMGVYGGKVVKLDFNIPVKKNCSVECAHNAGSRANVYIMVKHEVSN